MQLTKNHCPHGAQDEAQRNEQKIGLRAAWLARRCRWKQLPNDQAIGLAKQKGVDMDHFLKYLAMTPAQYLRKS